MMPSPRAIVANVLRPVLRALEGQPRQGPYYLPISGGWLPAGADCGWWQQGHSLVGGERLAIIEACISAYSQTCAMLPGNHYRANVRGGRDRITTSALSRILRAPNAYMTPSDFLLNAVRSLYLTGNCYALALRSHRFEIEELHLMDPDMSAPAVAADGQIFYALQGNDVIERQLGERQILVPQRDVLHIRLHSNRQYPRPLVGKTPLAATFGDIATYESIRGQHCCPNVERQRRNNNLTDKG
jgi:phage portal protein BeeE